MTTLEEICDVEKLDFCVDTNLVKVTYDPLTDLRIYNYTPQAQYSNSFDIPEVRLSRGLIVNSSNLVVGRAFEKFGNVGEYGVNSVYGEIPITETPFITEKLDGSLGIIFRYDNKLRIATRGSFISTQAIWGQQWIDRNIDPDLMPEIDGVNTTLCVEIICPESRVVVQYKQDKLVALSGIDNHTGKDRPVPSDWSERFDATPVHIMNVDTVLAMAGQDPDNSKNREGFVVAYYPSCTRVKVKFGEYLMLHKAVCGLNRRSLWQYWAAEKLVKLELDFKSIGRIIGSSVEDAEKYATGLYGLLDVLPDEMYESVKEHIMDFESDICSKYSALDEIMCVVKDLDRKQVYAAVGDRGLASAVFMVLDGRDPLPAMLKSMTVDATKIF